MSFQISRILHAGYLLESQGIQIAFDPLVENPFSQNCYAFPKVEFDLQAIRSLKLDAIFISHYHDDHFSVESLQHFDRKTPIYFFSIFAELFDLLKRLGFEKVYKIEVSHLIEIGPFNILPLEALDIDIDSFFHIQVDNLNILNVVDAWIAPEVFASLLKTEWDLVLWPFQTLREIEAIAPSAAEDSDRKLPHEWLEQLEKLNPCAVVPSSCQFQFEAWSWLNKVFFPISYVSFEKQIHQILPGTQVQRLNPGETMSYKASAWQKQGRLDWVKPIGDQNADYQFEASIQPSPTSEIAARFKALTKQQTEFIQSYCQEQLMTRWASLETDTHSVFSEFQYWRLKIYDHTGLAQEFQYLIKQNHIQSTPLSAEATWTTEIPASKLYGALTDGESLTSLYVRVIPAKTIDPSVDPLADPLIRCLYEGSIGSYQKAQLKKLGY